MTYPETTTMIKKSRGLDPFLLTGIALILAFGIVMATSASYIIAAGKFGDGFYYAKKQGMAMVMGLSVMYVFSLVDPGFWKLAVYPLLGIGILLLGLVFVPGIGVEMGDMACASPVMGSMMSMVSPAKSTNTFSPSKRPVNPPHLWALNFPQF